MDVFEITGFQTGVSQAGVNYLQPSDSFQDIFNGFIYRQVLQSRKGFTQFSLTQLDSRVMGIFEHVLPDNTTQLLITTLELLWRYNQATNAFDQIPFGGSLAAVTGFGIVSNDAYVSGTTYPFPDGTQRFVFTSKGMTRVYQYDGTQVSNYTNVGDNPSYAQPVVNGASVALTNATHVIWFGERLNFFTPILGGITYPQGVLFSGIRTISGNGDKYNIPGAGLLQVDTFEYMTGVEILGDQIIMNFFRSNWSLEKTRDAFNPYFPRKIPSVLGTDGSFSTVSYANRVESLGKTGIIATDTRESLRVDDKIPYFTRDNIDPNDIELTYGGFDDNEGQFLFAYRDNESVLEGTQDKVLVHNYEEGTWSVNDQRFSCFGQAVTGQNLTWDDIYEVNNPSWIEWDTTEELWDNVGLTSQTQKTLAGDDLGFVYQINQDYDDYYFTIIAPGISQATSAVITLGPHPFKVGDEIEIDGVTGMDAPTGQSINETQWFITAITATEITINLDTTAYTAWVSGGSVSKLIAFEAKLIPFNPYRDKGLSCLITHMDFLLNVDGGFLYIDLYADEQETPYKANVLIQPPIVPQATKWMRITVGQEADFHTMVLRMKSAGVQVRLTSIRIYCRPGGFTNA